MEKFNRDEEAKITTVTLIQQFLVENGYEKALEALEIERLVCLGTH
jgi:hypothetical protein